MATKRKQMEEAKADAQAKLRAWLKMGKTVYTVVSSVSASGMTRRIKAIIVRDREAVNVSRWVAAAVGFRFDERDCSVILKGCGMDMGFHLVNSLSYALHGYPSDAIRCRKHAQQEHGYCNTRDCFHAGYTLVQRWL